MALDLKQPIDQLLCRLIEIPSVSHSETAIADAVFHALQGLEMFSVERLGNNVVARTDLGKPERVLLAGHLDTVPPAGNEAALMSTDDRGRPAVFGIGACDMKGGVAAMLAAAASIDVGLVRRDVTFVFYECEEVAGEHNGLLHVHRQRPDLMAADVAVLCEPSNAGIEAGCQGTLRARITTRGIRAHTARAWRGVNAIHGAAEILQRLVNYSPRTPEISGLQFHEGLQAVHINGGVAGNVVPDQCDVTVNFRFAPDLDDVAAISHVRQVFEGFDVEVLDCAIGAYPHIGDSRISELIGLCSKMANPAVAPKLGWTDVARFAALGIPAVNFGPGDPALAHSAGECVAVDDVRACADVLSVWLNS